MALIKAGTGAGELSGKAGGSVFARNMGGMYMRAWARPTGLTPAQVTRRASLSLFSQAWKDLTESGREAWRLYASLTPIAGRFGESINVSGFNMFVRAATLMNLVVPDLDPAVVTAPSTPGLSDIPFLEDLMIQESATPSTTGPTITCASSTFSDSEEAINLLWLSPPVSAGVQYYKGPWKLGIAASGDSLDWTGGPDASLAPLDIYLEGVKVFVMLRQMISYKASGYGIYGPVTIDAAP